MGILDMVGSYVGRLTNIPHDDCLEYHKALRTAAFAQATPVQVD